MTPLYDHEKQHEAMRDAASELFEALRLHHVYETTPTDRGGKDGPKGKAWSAFIAARDAALTKARGGQS